MYVCMCEFQYMYACRYVYNIKMIICVNKINALKLKLKKREVERDLKNGNHFVNEN